jgi:hypothetical protein
MSLWRGFVVTTTVGCTKKPTASSQPPPAMTFASVEAFAWSMNPLMVSKAQVSSLAAPLHAQVRISS